MKVTPGELDLLQLLSEGQVLKYTMGIRRPGTWRVGVAGEWNGSPVRSTAAYNLRNKGYLQITSDPLWSWRNADYVISDKGILVLAKCKEKERK